jgi:hypothetical protein
MFIVIKAGLSWQVCQGRYGENPFYIVGIVSL